MLFEGGSWRVAMKEFRARKGRFGYVAAVERGKDPTTSPSCFTSIDRRIKERFPGVRRVFIESETELASGVTRENVEAPH